MKSKTLGLLAAGLLLGPMAAQADLITGGDFNSTTLSGPNNYTISTSLNTWLMNNYSLQASGPSGGATDLFAQHSTAGGGTDHRLVQFIDASALSSGQSLSLLFDYVYAEAAGLDPQARVSLIGIAADRSYSLFGGAGVDGIFNASGDFGVASPDVLLAQLVLAYTSSWSTNNLLEVTLSGTYAYIGVVFTSGCFGTTTCGTLRGIDNVQLTATGVPEPGSLALLGLGVLGAGVARRLKAR